MDSFYCHADKDKPQLKSGNSVRYLYDLCFIVVEMAVSLSLSLDLLSNVALWTVVVPFDLFWCLSFLRLFLIDCIQLNLRTACEVANANIKHQKIKLKKKKRVFFCLFWYINRYFKFKNGAIDIFTKSRKGKGKTHTHRAQNEQTARQN